VLSKKRWVMGLIALVALFAAACAEEEEVTPPADDVEAVDFQACLVTDEGGVDDRSFNETAWAGVEQAEAQLGVETALLESSGPDDYEPNINAFIAQGCDIIVTVGFLLGDDTAAAAEANPEQLFAIVDFNFFDEETGEDVTYENVRELTFGTDEAAFLAGYLAAGMTETGRLGTFGGIPIPPVTIFMNGFEAGMNYYNEQKGTDVELLGWDAAAEDGLFTGDFTNQDNGRRVTETLLEEGADIILPVAGPVGLGAAAAVEDAGDAMLIWVDTDGCVSASDFCPLFLTSIMKNMDVAVFDSIQAALEERFEGGLYVGTLENDGVGIAPYHEFEGEIPDDLKTEIEEVRQGVIEGSIPVAP
jgi:basic membrane protein A and related proteins